jgi:hypothetical protein
MLSGHDELESLKRFVKDISISWTVDFDGSLHAP